MQVLYEFPIFQMVLVQATPPRLDGPLQMTVAPGGVGHELPRATGGDMNPITPSSPDDPPPDKGAISDGAGLGAVGVSCDTSSVPHIAIIGIIVANITTLSLFISFYLRVI